MMLKIILKVIKWVIKLSDAYALFIAVACQMICNLIYSARIDRLERDLKEVNRIINNNF